MISASEASSPSAAYGALVARFGEGWQQGSADIMAEVFTPSAVFVPGPFDTPVKGLDAIRAYWRDVPQEQAEVAFRYGEIFVVGPWFATEFKCTFRRRRSGEPVVVKGALFCETAEGKISEMRMYWERVVQRNR
jgi:ketosteroid isomerase-like protein